MPAATNRGRVSRRLPLPWERVRQFKVVAHIVHVVRDDHIKPTQSGRRHSGARPSVMLSGTTMVLCEQASPTDSSSSVGRAAAKTADCCKCCRCTNATCARGRQVMG